MAVPSATARLCDTSTSPTIGCLPQARDASVPNRKYP
jgi:hypothetical protein